MNNRRTSILLSGRCHPLSTCRVIAWSLCLLFSIGPASDARARAFSSPARANAGFGAAGQGDADVRVLEPGKTIERELKGGESHSYTVRLATDEYMNVTFEQHGVDVAVALFGPDGKKLAETNSWKAASESLAFLADVAGDHRIEVRAAEREAAPGRYQTTLAALRPATEADRDLAKALLFFREAYGLAEKAKFDEAKLAAERALSLREKALGPAHLEVALALNLLGRILEFKGELAPSGPLYRRALIIEEQALGPEHIDLGRVLNDFAALSHLRGDYPQARQLYLRTLAIREKWLGPDHLTVATLLNNLANLSADEGDYAQAELLHRRALAIREKGLGPEHPSVAASFANLGVLYRDKGDYEQAESLLRRALPILEKALGADHPNVALLFYNLAAIADLRGDYAQAELLQRQALERWEKRLGADHTQVALSLQRLAGLYEKQGDYAKAEPLYQRALAINEKAFGPDHPDVGTTLNDLGHLYFMRGQEGDDARAESLLGRALGVLEKALGDHPKVAQTLDNLARLHQARGDVQQALAFSTRFNEARERHLRHNLPLGSERQKLGYLRLFAADIDNALSLHAQLAPRDQQALHLAFTTLLRRKGRGLEAMYDNIAALRRRAGPQDQALFARLAVARSRLATMALSGASPGKAAAAAYQSEMRQIEQEVDTLDGEISARSAEFRTQTQPITLAAVQAAIPAGAALVEFAVYRPTNVRDERQKSLPRYAAYLLTRQGRAQWVDLGEVAVIDRAVEAWRQGLRDPRRADVRRLARAVDAKVLQPVRALLGTSRHLLVSPDGQLNLVPFGALVDERNSYLVERYLISYLTSGRDLLRLQIPRASKNLPVVVADPAFGGPALIASRGGAEQKGGRDNAGGRVDYSQIFFGPLPGVSDEVRALKELLPQATLLVREQATEAALRRISAPQILHIATHGFFLQDVEGTAHESRAAEKTRLGRWAVRVGDPLLRSGLALAGANQGSNGGDDGVLTALEAVGLDLWGTKLVVLSACDTGLGEVKNGDGVYGLRRALVLAGAESHMMSLWPVSDRSTRDLIVGYYKGLTLDGQGRGEALRQVQLQMLRGTASAAHRHPFYWASFIQSGEWANLDGKR